MMCTGFERKGRKFKLLFVEFELPLIMEMSSRQMGI